MSLKRHHIDLLVAKHTSFTQFLGCLCDARPPTADVLERQAQRTAALLRPQLGCHAMLRTQSSRWALGRGQARSLQPSVHPSGHISASHAKSGAPSPRASRQRKRFQPQSLGSHARRVQPRRRDRQEIALTNFAYTHSRWREAQADHRS